MSYKTILVHVDQSPHAPARIRFAAALANTHGAHLIGVASTGVSRFMNIDNASNFDPAVLASYLDRMNDQARQGLVQFEALARESCTGSWEGRLVADNPEEALVMMSRFTDLVVMSQTDPDNAATGAMRDLPEFMILNAARPVLLLPYAGSHGPLNGKALVAWNGSLEASHALAQALPLLRGASEVLVAQFNAPADPGLREQEADLAAWLARHGVPARVEAQQQTAIDEGNALLSLAADRGVGLLVMGAYGHTRLRELVLGGVTRTMLQSMTIPVFMAH
jgi:nucleotide-binding universal stress UspA family protein